ncbi:MAG: carbohydrate binding domain-containing protein [Planctomycetes bacterium]|nr:carbohydrate binding domain-containing protein [Planctomycetota bacterium]
MTTATMPAILLGLILGTGALASAADAAAAERHKLVFIQENFMDPKQTDDAIAVITQAAKAGYTGIMVNDAKFARWFETTTVHRDVYDANVKRMRQACRDNKLKCYVFSCEFTTDLLSNDPNLAEGMPVVGAPFVVKDGRLMPVDEDAKLLNPSFEDAKRADEPAAWNVDDPGSVCFLDHEVHHEGATSLRIQDIKGKNAHGNGRITQTFAVKPFRYYNLSLWVKTQDFQSTRTIDLYVQGSQGLAYHSLGIEATQDWKRIDIPFNTLDSTEVTFRFGSWGGQTGKLWVDDISLVPGGFVNLIRRDALPFTITSADGKTTYTEGKDVADAKDPKLGMGRWPGDFQEWYEQPVVRVPAGSRLKEGDRVLASYSHAMIVLGYSVFTCMNEPKVWPLIKRNLHEMHTVLQPDGYIIVHDELRHQGWDETCKKSGKTMEKTLSDHFAACVAMVRAEDPGKTIFAWNDMFDPSMNAAKNGQPYHLVKGIDPWYGAFKSLDKDIVILNWNWNGPTRKDSLKHFADLGLKQVLCGYYDASSDELAPWLAEAAALKGIVGVMYTTWSNNFSDLEKFSRIADGKPR